MKEKLRFLGLDVHAVTIAVAVAEPDGEVRSLGTIPNRAESIRKLIKKLGSAEKLRACYKAGAAGYPSPTNIRADNYSIRGVPLPYQKFPRAPED